MLYKDIEEKVNSLNGFMGSIAQREFMFNLGKMSKLGAEIGSFKGLSAFIVGSGMSLNGGSYYCIDTFKAENPELQDEDTFIAFSQAIKGLEHIIKPVMALSCDQKALVTVPNNLDFVYIDGAHDEENVWKDTVNYYDKVRKGGLLLFHDHTWVTVKAGIDRAIKDLAAQGAILELVYFEDDFGVYRK